MIDGEEENEICLLDRFGPLISCPGHRSEDDVTLWKLFFNYLQKRDGTEDLTHGCGMDPNRFFEGESWQKSNPLNQAPSKPSVDKSPEQEIRRSENKENSNKGIV